METISLIYKICVRIGENNKNKLEERKIGYT